MQELDHKESWAPKNWCFRTVVLKKTLESPLDFKIKPINPKGNQPWIFIGRTDVKLKFQYFGRMVKELIEKDIDAEKDWRHEKKGVTEDEMVEWHHQLNGHEFEQTLLDSEGQRSLASCSPCGHKEKPITHYKILPGLGEVCKFSKCKIRFWLNLKFQYFIHCVL